jgi:hypothetical protein
MGYVFATREDPTSTANLGFYDDGQFSADTSPASLFAADYYDIAVVGEPFMYARLSTAQRAQIDKYVVPVAANRVVGLTGTLNAYIVRLVDDPSSTVALRYWNGADFTAGASAAELNTAEVYVDGSFNEAELYQRRAYIQESAPNQYVEMIRVAASITLV